LQHVEHVPERAVIVAGMQRRVGNEQDAKFVPWWLTMGKRQPRLSANFFCAAGGSGLETMKAARSARWG